MILVCVLAFMEFVREVLNREVRASFFVCVVHYHVHFCAMGQPNTPHRALLRAAAIMGASSICF